MMSQKKQTFNVLFWIRKGRTNEKLSPLSCRVTISGQRYEIPTKLYLRSESWSAVAQKSLGKTANDKEANRYIEDLKITIEDTVTKIRTENIPSSTLRTSNSCFRHRIMSSLPSAHCLITMNHGEEKSPCQYICRLSRKRRKHLLNFIRIKYHVSDYDLTAIDKAFRL